MISKEQLDNEQRKEREYNKLFEAVISKSPFGQWYPLMIGASNLLTRNLPKRVGIDKEGRPIVVYKGEVGKAFGVWLEPTHKVIARDFSRKKYGSGIAAFFGFGQIKEMVRQKRAKFFDISPKEVWEVRNRKKGTETFVNNGDEDPKLDLPKPQEASMGKNIFGTILILGLVFGAIKMWK